MAGMAVQRRLFVGAHCPIGCMPFRLGQPKDHPDGIGLCAFVTNAALVQKFSEAVPEATHPPETLEGMRVLAVEDNATNRLVLKKLLA